MQKALRPIYSFEDFTLDLSRGCLLHGAREVKLRNKSLEVLTYLVENRGRLVTRDELIGTVWPDSFVSDESVTQCLMEVRRALSDDSQRYVRTVPRRGYIFDMEVKESGKENVLKAEPLGAEGGKNRSSKLDGTSVAEGEDVRTVIQETNGESLCAKVEEPPEATPQIANGIEGSEEKRHSQRRPRITLMAVVLGAIFGAAVLLALYLRPSLPPPRVLRYVQITNDGQQKVAPLSYTQPLLTDSSRLYCSEFRGGRPLLVQVSTAGGETVPLMMPFHEVWPSALSPNRSELLVNVDQGLGLDGYSLWLFPLLGGSPRRLIDRPAKEGAWSRDGQKMVYVGADSSLYLARSDGSDPRKLVSVPNPGGWVRWFA